MTLTPQTSMRRLLAVIAATAIISAAATPAFAGDDIRPGFLAAPATTSVRPGVLVPMYVSFAALQVLDAATTLHNVGNGASEANPVMTPVIGSPAAFIATKGALAAASIYCTEKVWKKNRVAAVALMIGLNSLSATVVARNYATRDGR